MSEKALDPSPQPARVAGLLADEARLRAFAAVALGARTLRAVTESAGLDERAAAVALERLAAAGLVVQGELGLGVRLDALRAAARERPPRRRELPGATAEQQVVLRNFVEDGRLTEIPARAGRRRVVLEYLAGLFEPGVEYEEGDVNETLRLFHRDHATLRRHLVDAGLLERDQGVYRRRTV